VLVFRHGSVVWGRGEVFFYGTGVLVATSIVRSCYFSGNNGVNLGH
jgi:hypothetical protein